MKKIIFLVIILIQCAVIKREIWSDYSVRYAGSQKELNEFIEDITKRGYEYQIISYESEHVYEIHYRKIKSK